MNLAGRDVIVIGGGIAGLAVARAMDRRGAHVRVLEQAGAFREVGAGVQISPNGVRVLQALGLEAALHGHALRGTAITLRKGQTGAQVLRMALPETGPGFYMLHRADLVALLQAALPGHMTRLGARVQSVVADGPRPGVTLDNGEVLRADLIVGADGLHSVVRPVVLGQPTTPFFTGQVAWRTLIPCAGDAPEAQVFMGPGRHLVSYPVRGAGLRNIIAVEERAAWADEGWHHEDDPAHLRKAFAGFGGPVPGWLAQVKHVHLWGLFRHPLAENWSRGHAVIMGDAAHPTLPFMAQGANMALEDAWVLARCLGAADTIPKGLAAYQLARRNRVLRVIDAANRNARNYHLRPPMAGIAHLALQMASKITPNAALRQFGWIYDHDVTAS